MSTTVTYKGDTLTTVDNDTKTLLTEGKYLEDDITLTDVSGGGSSNLLPVTMTNSRTTDILFYKVYDVNGTLGGNSTQAIAGGATKEFYIPFNIGSTGSRTNTYYFMQVRKGTSAPVFSSTFSNDVYGPLTIGNYDVYRTLIPYTFTGDSITCTVS